MRSVPLLLLSCAMGCALDHTGGPPIDAGAPGVDAVVPLRDARPPLIDATAPIDSPVEQPDQFVPDDAFAMAPSHAGYVVVGNYDTGAMTTPYLEAQFFAALSPAMLMDHIYDPACTIIEQVPPCRLLSCSSRTDTEQAGALHMTAGPYTLDAPAPMQQMGPPNYSEYFAGAPSGSIPAGTVIAITGTGATVPAFAQMLTMPGSPRAMLPAVVSRSADYVVAWAPTMADQVWVGIGSQSPTDPYIECVAPASQGRIAVASALIADFALGTSVYTWSASANARDVAVGDYLVEFVGWDEAAVVMTSITR